jgi:hypothetical protein
VLKQRKNILSYVHSIHRTIFRLLTVCFISPLAPPSSCIKAHRRTTTKRILLEPGGARRRIHETCASPTMAMLYFLATIGLLSTVSECFSMLSSPTSITQELPCFHSCENGVVIVAGSTGYIGRKVVRESIQQGYRTVALVRDMQKVKSCSLYADDFHGAQIVECDVSDPLQVLEVRVGSNARCRQLRQWNMN